jgi:hypothetical protein
MEGEPRSRKRIVLEDDDSYEEAETQFDVEVGVKFPPYTNSSRSQWVDHHLDIAPSSLAAVPTTMDGPDPQEIATPPPDAANEASAHLRTGARLRSERKSSPGDEPEPTRTSDAEVGAQSGNSGDLQCEKSRWLESWLDT